MKATIVSFETIQQMANQIVAAFKPERIILFGSYARGTADEHSDVDLLVLLKEAPPPGRRGAPIRRMLARDFHFPIDVVVRTVQGFAAWQNVPGSLAREVSREGRVLYEKAE